MLINLVDENSESTTVAYDLSDGDETFQILMNDDYGMGLQLITDSVVGTLDGTIKLYQSNTPNLSNGEQIGTTITLSAAGQIETIEKNNFNFEYLFVDVVANNITGGNLKILLSRKEN